MVRSLPGRRFGEMAMRQSSNDLVAGEASHGADVPGGAREHPQSDGFLRFIDVKKSYDRKTLVVKGFDLDVAKGSSSPSWARPARARRRS